MNHAGRPKIDRRTMLKAAAGFAAATWAGPVISAEPAAKTEPRIKQSVCRWCYTKPPFDKLETLATECAKLGYKSVELLNPPEYLKIKPLGVTCAMLNGGRSVNITNCLNRTENHAAIEKDLKAAIDFAAAEKLPNVICFSGNRKGMPDDVGLKNCATGLKRIVGHAEKNNVTICMELLNSARDHKDYMCDKTEWGVALCQKVGSPRFKLLYDIYHMGVMGEDIIPVIKANKDYIGHYHTGGVPGRNEIDDTQTLNYAEIMRAIVATGFTGYVGQEFIPKRDPLASLTQAYRICNV